MAENNSYGSCEILLDKILVTEECLTYKHSFLIEDFERQILRTIAERNNDAKLNEHLHGLAEDLINLSAGLNKELDGAGPQ